MELFVPLLEYLSLPREGVLGYVVRLVPYAIPGILTGTVLKRIVDSQPAPIEAAPEPIEG